MQFLHCSEFAGTDRDVVEGELLGFTGGLKDAPGSGSSTGAHVHVHLVDPNGVREDVMPWFANSPAPAPSGDRAEIQALLAARGYYGGPIDGQFGPQSWTAVQTLGADFGFYDANYIDGIAGKRTAVAMQLYAQKNGNYPHAVDGILGPLTWAGFAQSLREDAPAAPAPVVVPPVAPVAPVPPVTPPPVIIPDKEPAMTPAEQAEQDKQIATLPPADLGVIIQQPGHRKLAYALYSLASLLVTNAAVAYAALGAQFPPALTVAIAVIGNLAVPFSALAIANAKK
jgi:hypothetical protein